MSAQGKRKKRVAIATLISSFFVAGTCPFARAERHGIAISAVLDDKSRTKGELLAVRRSSIVIQEDSGHVTFIDVANIKYIEKAKRSAVVGAVTGFVKFGFIGGVIGDLASASNVYKDTLGSGTVLGSVAGALLGGVLGGIQGAPTNAVETIWIQGIPRDKIDEALVKLSRDARIRNWS